MSESKSGSAAVKIILSVGFVLAVLMVIGFGGVFYLFKYNHDQEMKAAELERAKQEQLENRERAGAIGGALGRSLGKQFAEKLGDSEDAEKLRDAAATLGETLGKEFSEAGRSEELKEALEAAGETLTDELQQRRDADATQDTESVDSNVASPDSPESR